MAISQELQAQEVDAPPDPIEVQAMTYGPMQMPAAGWCREVIQTESRIYNWLTCSSSELEEVARHLRTERRPYFWRDGIYYNRPETDDELRGRLRGLVPRWIPPGTPSKFDDAYCARCGQQHTTVDCVG